MSAINSQKRVGQPLKLKNPEIKKKLLDAISKGASYEIACWYAGVSYRQFNEWRQKMRRIEEGDIDEINDLECLASFIEELETAQGEAACRWLDGMENSKKWQAFAWKLERRYGDHFPRPREQDNNSNKTEENDIKKAIEILNKCVQPIP